MRQIRKRRAVVSLRDTAKEKVGRYWLGAVALLVWVVGGTFSALANYAPIGG